MLWWLIGALALGLGGWSAVSAHRVLHPRPKPVLPYTPAIPTHTHTLRDQRQQPFDIHALCAASPRGVLILCHGYFANHQQVMPVADGLARRGYTTVVFDFPAHGQRRGRCTFGKEETEIGRAHV